MTSLIRASIFAVLGMLLCLSALVRRIDGNPRSWQSTTCIDVLSGGTPAKIEMLECDTIGCRADEGQDVQERQPERVSRELNLGCDEK